MKEALSGPFFRHIFAGTLPIEIFDTFVRQDILFLQKELESVKIVAKKCDVAKDLAFFNDIIEEVKYEISFYREYLPGEVGGWTNPLFKEYAEHIVKTASKSSLSEYYASLLPCLILFKELGKKDKETDENNPYYWWIERYNDNNLIAKIGEQISFCQERCEMPSEAYNRSRQYELMLYDSLLTAAL